MNTKRTVLGIGETILDIIFKQGQPVAAVPGGSCFNSIVSVGRTGIPCLFAGYSADDAVGKLTKGFLEENGVSTAFFELREGEKSSVSLAWLNDKGDADYIFYKLSPCLPISWPLPSIGRDSILLMGSYFAVCSGTRHKIRELLSLATQAEAIVYYDLNFRRSHLKELPRLMPSIRNNMRRSTVVRGSADDFEVMYGTREAEEIYSRHVKPYCPLFVCTDGAGPVAVCTPSASYSFPSPRLASVVSTVGAGDNFNAGFVHGLLRNGITRASIASMSERQWSDIVSEACAFASQACLTTDNYISRDFARSLSLTPNQ